MIVQARKPDFFNYNMSLYEVVTDDGLMRPVMKARKVRLETNLKTWDSRIMG